MIEFGLVLLLASLLPALLGLLGVKDPMRTASSFVALFLIVHIGFVSPLFIRARRGTEWPLGIRLLDIATFTGLLVAVVSQSMNALAFGFATPAGGFLLGLYALLVVSGLNFALLAYLMLLPEADVPEADVPEAD